MIAAHLGFMVHHSDVGKLEALLRDKANMDVHSELTESIAAVKLETAPDPFK